MLTTKQKSQLKGLASTLDTKYQIGKNEVSETVISMLDKALVAKELIKINVMKGYTNPIMQLALDLSSALNSEIVDVLGRTIILYKANKEKPKIKLVK